MATYNLPITYPDGSAAVVLDALKSYYNVGTNQEAINAFGVEVRGWLKDRVRNHQRTINAAQFESTEPIINITES